MKKRNRVIASAPFRILAGIGLPLLVLIGAWILYTFGNPLICVFYQLTGLYCPGCGSGRASVALLHLDFAAAFGYNLLYVLLLPFIVYYLLKQYIILVFRKDVLPMFSIDGLAAKIVLVVILMFWILRNIPVIPFTLLAP